MSDIELAVGPSRAGDENVFLLAEGPTRRDMLLVIGQVLSSGLRDAGEISDRRFDTPGACADESNG